MINMKYNLNVAGYYYEKPDQSLIDLGFEFIKTTRNAWNFSNAEYTICTQKQIQIDITSFKQLKEFIKKYGRIVLTEDSILIYNAYIE